ncbi:hypothetical protein GM31_08415 [Trabulsiella odontotermitis]|uniref:Uncharacterized protein n=1 Tax=Trabulsiella odontotermitis TaxID=379893 RepID=A0A0L0GJX1_9ENTR|nr:hypothetical protein GM31_08415 [Trabulsiella odontotermitis]KNC89264.1 hypothetical protein GM30_08135 [Trabulsiella odontotermitis]
MISISEYYETSAISLAINKKIFINNQYFGLFLDISGHDLDRDVLAFIFKLENNQLVSIPAYDTRINFVYEFENGQKSYLNPLLHCLMVNE